MTLSTTPRILGALVFAGVLAASRRVGAVPDRLGEADGAPAKESSWASSRSLVQNFGAATALRLLHGGDALDATKASENAVRGVERALALGTAEGVALVVQLLLDGRGLARTDAHVLLAATRALAPFAGQTAVARVLAESVLSAPVTRAAASEEAPASAAPDPERRARVELARQTAALALATSGDEHAQGLVLSAARGSGPGQSAARHALRAYPPARVDGPLVVTPLTPGSVAVAGALGDPRAIEGILVAGRSLEVPLRAAALRALGSLAEPRGIAVAREAVHDSDPSVRVAATLALVDLGAPDAATAIRSLIEDAATAESGIAQSSRVSGQEIVGALASRIRATSDLPQRRACVAALGRQGGPSVVAALTELLSDPLLRGDAAEAIARSTAAGAGEAVANALAKPETRRLGARMVALRGRVFGDLPARVRPMLRELARAKDGKDRAAGLAALVLLSGVLPGRIQGAASALEAGLEDPDRNVRRAVAGACDPTSVACARALLERLDRETDPDVRRVLAGGLAANAANDVTTRWLESRVFEGDIDAPVAALALARRAGAPEQPLVESLLASRDVILRDETVRGLGTCPEPWAVGLLAEAYELEVDPAVRRAVVLALAEHRNEADAPLRGRTLHRAWRFDPEDAIRTLADRAARGLPPPEPSPDSDLAWLRVMSGDGASPGPSGAPLRGVLERADGLALPVVFDEDGYALVPAPHGAVRLRLEPRL